MGMLNTIKTQRQQDQRSQIYSNLIRREARIGGQLFGATPDGGRREFFCLDENTWIWHEEWTDKSGQRQSVTTRYDVRPNGVLKTQNGQTYQYIDQAEATNLVKAAKKYYARIFSEIYQPAI